MTKDFGVKPYLFPMPTYMIGTYNEDDTVDVMMMAWGGICAEDMVALNLEADHKTVANLEASLTGENLGADMTQQYIGNVNAGTENSVDFDLVPTTTGTVNGTIVLNYEAEDGSLKTVSKDFSINVMEMPAYDDTMMDPGMVEPTAQPGLPVWGIVLIAVAVVVVVVAVILVVRRRKKKKAAALADLEADDEDL